MTIKDQTPLLKTVTAVQAYTLRTLDTNLGRKKKGGRCEWKRTFNCDALN